MKEKVSVIIPVYNTMKYLKRCLNSIMKQSYINLEIICVNDGSTDESIEVLREYSNIDKRFKIIDKENGGPSSARNAGLAAANSKYIMFVDSDDEVHLDMIKILMQNMEKYDADISMCNTVEIYEYDKFEKKQYINNDLNNVIIDNNIEVMNSFFTYGIANISPCGKLFRREILNNIYFRDDISNNEDRLFLYFVYSMVNKIVYTSEKMYYYIKRKNSLSSNSNKFSKNFLDVLKVSQIIENHVITNDKEHVFFCKYHNYLSTLNLYRMLSKSYNKSKFRQQGKEMRRYLIINYKDLKRSLPLKRRVEVLLIKYIPILFDIMWEMKSKMLFNKGR